ncbi:MAG TPA: hypothetical protein VEF04_14880 [Blastocatellia bacterium]|nr:hypothetical protein [Blastocatellia bacterium]
MSYSFRSPRYFMQEVDDDWHIFAEYPGEGKHRHVHGPLKRERAWQIAEDLNRNIELREEALRDEYWSKMPKC